MSVVELSPGVRSYERPSGARVVRGAPVGILLAIGSAPKGPIGVPKRVISFQQFTQIYGEDYAYGELALQVRQFFNAGGGEVQVVRAADVNARGADVTLQSEFGANVLEVRAIDAGVLSNQIRVDVDYDTADPEMSFALTIYREVIDSLGRPQREASERFSNLSMDPNSAQFAERVVNGNSALVELTSVASEPDFTTAHEGEVYSQSGLYFANVAALTSYIGAISNPTIVIEIDGTNYATVDLGSPGSLSDIETLVNNALASQSISANVEVTFARVAAGQPGALRFALDNTGARSIRILPAASNDASGALHLGAGRGGLEVGIYSGLRPALSGFSTTCFSAAGNLARLNTLLNTVIAQGDTASFADGTSASPFALGQWVVAGTDYATTDRFMRADKDTDYASYEGSLANLRQHLDKLVAVMNSAMDGMWTFRRNDLRIVGAHDGGVLSASLASALSTSANAGPSTDIFNNAIAARRASFALGQDGGATGSDGNAPVLSDYLKIYSTVASEVDLFNMLIQPRCKGQTDADRAGLWPSASSFARDENAVLIIDPPSESGAWKDVFEIDGAISDFRNGIVPESSCLFWPGVFVPVGKTRQRIDPCGTIAGIMAGNASRYGVWFAAAGIRAPLIGAVGLQYKISDAENGVINPKAVNALRQKSIGGVAWGARTLKGDDSYTDRDYAYISVRMTTNFIKNSLERALDSFTFMPNNEKTWAQIRMMCNAFMHGLYNQGAFKGEKVEDAYEVLCDASTTTPANILSGELNVWIKYAPLFPAEFIHIYIQQLVAQPQN